MTIINITFRTLRAVFVLALLGTASNVYAQNNNKVVVIPLAGNLVTEQYTGVPPIIVDNDNQTISIEETTPVVFKVRGNGFAVKDIDGGTTIETNIWDIEVYDTRNAFSNDRFTVPETGYYYLQATVSQSNFVTDAFFRINFNIDPNSRYSQIMDGDDVKINVSGIYFLNVGQQVYVNLRNFSVGEDERVDGTGSWFEGYKIN